MNGEIATRKRYVRQMTPRDFFVAFSLLALLGTSFIGISILVTQYAHEYVIINYTMFMVIAFSPISCVIGSFFVGGKRYVKSNS